MTKERAQYIIKNEGRFGTLRWAFESPLMKPPFFTGEPIRQEIHQDGITPTEWEFAKCVWILMDGTKSFYDAVKAIAEG